MLRSSWEAPRAWKSGWPAQYWMRPRVPPYEYGRMASPPPCPMTRRHWPAISSRAGSHEMGSKRPSPLAPRRRLAVLFALVYFSQGMWYLPIQTITIVLKDRGLSAGQVADFFAITIIPWLIKPVYGLLSDFVPLLGYRRKSYLLLTSATAALAGVLLFPSAAPPPPRSRH